MTIDNLEEVPGRDQAPHAENDVVRIIDRDGVNQTPKILINGVLIKHCTAYRMERDVGDMCEVTLSLICEVVHVDCHDPGT